MKPKHLAAVLCTLISCQFAQAYYPAFSNIQGRTVVLGSSWFYFEYTVTDPVRNTTVTGSSSSYYGGPASGDIYVRDNVVVWIARNPSSNNVGFATYDAELGAWRKHEFTSYSNSFLGSVSSLGVVTWIVDAGSNVRVYCYTYEPYLNQWTGTSDLVEDGSLSYGTNYNVSASRSSYNNLNTNHARYMVYDPRSQQWNKGHDYLPNSTFSLSGGTIVYFVSGQPKYIGYDPYAASGAGSWTSSPSKPLAHFHVAKVSQTVICTDTSVAASSISWDFGDGDTSTLRSPVHTYATPGTYTITQTVTGPNGESDVTTRQITL